MGSFGLRDPMVFAYEWASLDVISNGRTRLVACAGGGAGPLWEAETAAMGINPEDRRKHMVENMHVLRHLWTKDNAPFEGQFVKFSNITLEPKPIQNPFRVCGCCADTTETPSTSNAKTIALPRVMFRIGSPRRNSAVQYSKLARVAPANTRNSLRYLGI